MVDGPALLEEVAAGVLADMMNVAKKDEEHCRVSANVALRKKCRLAYIGDAQCNVAQQIW